jgi:transposase-like protein
MYLVGRLRFSGNIRGWGNRNPTRKTVKKSKFTEAQIAFALKQAESGIRVEEVCRKFGISQATFFNWKKVSIRATASLREV